MRIAVTGSTGLIGGRVYETLSAEGNDLVRIGRRDICDIRADLSDPASVAGIDLGGLDAMVHCASVVDEDFKADPQAAFIQSTLGLSTLIERALAGGVRALVYFSTAHVYGALEGRISEKSPVDPLTDYAIAHFASEQIIKRYAKAGGLKALVLRPNAVFGMPQSVATFDRWWLVPFSFPLDAVRRGEIALRSPGLQRRNFVATEDLARCAWRFLQKQERFTEYTAVNPVGPDTLSVYDFAVTCADVCREVTGRACRVSRPEPAPHEMGADFKFESVHDFYRPSVAVNEFLEILIREALADGRLGQA